MKICIAVALFQCCLWPPSHAQQNNPPAPLPDRSWSLWSLEPALAPEPARAPVPELASWPVVEQDQSSTTREYVEIVTNALTGELTPQVHRVITVGSGLNYRDEQGKWLPSKPLIQLTPDGGAAAVCAPHRLYAQANLNSFGAISLVTIANRVFRSHILGLFYFDPVSKKTARISGLRDSIVSV